MNKKEKFIKEMIIIENGNIITKKLVLDSFRNLFKALL